MLSIIAVSQLLIIIFEKIDEEALKKIIEKVSNSSRH
jgi:hypothetical protein